MLNFQADSASILPFSRQHPIFETIQYKDLLGSRNIRDNEVLL
jgi:hypothetical protein